MRVRNIAAVGLVLGALIPSLAFGFSGVFRSAYTEIGGSSPTGLAVGDFNGDGATDAVTTNAGFSSNELTFFQGFDDATIGIQLDLNVPLDSFPSGVLKGKFDNDDIDDLIVAKANDNAIVFLKGLADSQQAFAAPSDPIAVGHSPIGLAAADFIGNDGKLDLAVANEGGDISPGSVSILRGDGMGGFILLSQPNPDPQHPDEPVEAIPAELGTRALAIGNIDSDPGLDIVAVNTRSNTVSLYTSDGQGVFTSRGTLPTGVGAQDIALADLNNDAKLDLILAVANEDRVTVQFGNGDRTFGDAQGYPVGNTPSRLLVADINGDGLLDLMTSNRRSQDLSVLIASAPGMFKPARSYVADQEPDAIAVADFNSDELLDLASSNQGSEQGASVAILRNRGDGILHAVEDVPAGNAPSDVVVADLDGDASPDMAIASGSTVRILYGGSDGFRGPTSINVGGRVLAVVAADLNGDTLPDIAATDGDNNRVAVVLNRGAGQFGDVALYSTATGPGTLTVGDFNNDGRPDLAVTAVPEDQRCQGGPHPNETCRQQADCAPGGVCAGQGSVSVLLQQPNGQFPATPQNTQVEETPISVVSLDANCDGRDDLVVANLASSTVSVLVSNGDGTFSNPQTLPGTQIGASPSALVVADFDGNGVDDFAVSNSLAPGTVQNVHLLRGDCAGPFTPFPGGGIRVGELASALVARDITGDQIVDLLVVNQTGNEVNLLRGIGNGTMARFGQSDAVSRMPIAVAAGDFDSDGRYDGVTANNDPSANNVSVLYNCARDVGCDPFAVPGRPPNPPGSNALRGDANNDGAITAADFVAVGAEVMDGDGFAVESIGLGSYRRAVPGADANGDGRVDPQDRVAVAHRIFAGG